MKTLTVIGARPQFIKAATVSRAFREKNLKEVIVHTGQHYDANMSEVFFTEMDIPKPDYFLNISGLSHGAMTGQMMEKIEDVLKKESPDIVLVYGDTNSTLAGALAAVKLHIPVAHVEAGLRSFNMKMPEEVNRILTDRVSSRLFCPTAAAIKNLEDEGYGKFGSQITLSGDVMLDAAWYYTSKAETYQTLQRFGLNQGEYFLCTVHRAENTDDLAKLTNIIEALNILSDTAAVVVPLHPRTRKIIETNQLKARFTIIEPVGYFDMINLTRNSACVLTDSGGLQKEAYFFGKFCVTMRDQTEWVELVQAGHNRLTGADTKKITDAVEYFRGRKLRDQDHLYGDGRAAYRIIEHLS